MARNVNDPPIVRDYNHDALARQVYEDARKYHEVWNGLINVLLSIAPGYAITKQNERWHCMKRNGIYLVKGAHSFEDLMTAILEDIREQTDGDADGTESGGTSGRG